MLAVSDSTPLIHLAKIGKLNYLEKLFDNILIPKEVYEEIIIKGKKQNKSEVPMIEKAISNFIIVKDCNSTINQPNLDLGELKAISLCKEQKIRNLLIDENEGYDIALILGLKPLRTSAIILRLLNKKIINLKEFQESLINLSKSGYYLSAEIYNKLLETGKRLSLKKQ